MKTYAPKPQDVERRWYVVDAQGAVLGRLASEVARILRGKHKPIFAPHADTGDHVIVVNAKGIRLTGGKEEKKVAYRHSGFPGGLKETVYSRLLERRPAYVVEKAVRGMLPKNRLGRAMASKLQVYDGAEHPHQAQKPVPLALGEVPRWEGLPRPVPRQVEERPARSKAVTSRRSGTPQEGGTSPGGKSAPVKRTAARKTAKAASAKSTSSRRTAPPGGTKKRADTSKGSTRSTTGSRTRRGGRGREKKEG